MRIEIDIPKEFEEHFKQDKFKNSLERIMVDIKHSLENGDCLCAGRYEYETIKMLEEALENSNTAYNVNKVFKELNKLDVKAIKRYKGGTFGDYEGTDYYIKKSDAIEIVKQGGVSDASDNVCEWYKVNGNAYKCYTHAEIYDSRVFDWCVCPYCRKKIKVKAVE